MFRRQYIFRPIKLHRFKATPFKWQHESLQCLLSSMDTRPPPYLSGFQKLATRTKHAGNEKWNDPCKPSNWWFPLRGSPGSLHFSFPTYRTGREATPKTSLPIAPARHKGRQFQRRATINGPIRSPRWPRRSGAVAADGHKVLEIRGKGRGRFLRSLCGSPKGKPKGPAGLRRLSCLLLWGSLLVASLERKSKRHLEVSQTAVRGWTVLGRNDWRGDRKDPLSHQLAGALSVQERKGPRSMLQVLPRKTIPNLLGVAGPTRPPNYIQEARSKQA